jgi:hypothetical protein
MLKACWFFTLLFVALSMGMALAHALELIPKTTRRCISS